MWENSVSLQVLTVFEEKLLIFQEKSIVVCCEMFSEGARPAYVLEVSRL
jgi:hypothetical protein